MKDLKQLYQKVLLDQQNKGYRIREQAQHIIEAYNPVCGDQFKVYLDFESGKFKNVSFHGYGCAISKAATSLLVHKLSGKSMEESIKELEYFFNCMHDQVEQPPEIYRALALSKDYPGRQQCATLSWKAMEEFLLKEGSIK